MFKISYLLKLWGCSESKHNEDGKKSSTNKRRVKGLWGGIITADSPDPTTERPRGFGFRRFRLVQPFDVYPPRTFAAGRLTGFGAAVFRRPVRLGLTAIAAPAVPPYRGHRFRAHGSTAGLKPGFVPVNGSPPGRRPGPPSVRRQPFGGGTRAGFASGLFRTTARGNGVRPPSDAGSRAATSLAAGLARVRDFCRPPLLLPYGRLWVPFVGRTSSLFIVDSFTSKGKRRLRRRPLVYCRFTAIRTVTVTSAAL